MLAIHSSKLQKVVSTIQKLYPIAYADNAWDNTGLLVDSSSGDQTTSTSTTSKQQSINVLLTIDLTSAVVEEAIKLNSNVILAYHPFIFRGLKSITNKDPQQRSLIKLIQNGISVYSPHTAIDASPVGVNDWLIDGVVDQSNLLKKEFIEPNPKFNNVGMGRIVELKENVKLVDIINKLKSHLGLEYVQLALNSHVGNKDDAKVKRIAVCVGSGGSLFKGLKDIDLYLTGELSHHEALSLKENGSSVITCNHSNTERGFLRVLREQLKEQWVADDGSELVVEVSKVDSDPFHVV